MSTSSLDATRGKGRFGKKKIPIEQQLDQLVEWMKQRDDCVFHLTMMYAAQESRMDLKKLFKIIAGGMIFSKADPMRYREYLINYIRVGMEMGQFAKLADAEKRMHQEEDVKVAIDAGTVSQR